MRYYGLTYLISPSCEEEEIKKIQEKLVSTIQKEGGKLENSEIFGRKQLAHKIKGEEEAIFVNFNFYLNPEKVGNLEKAIRSEEKILRHLIFVKKAKKVIKTEKPKKVKKEKVELEKIEEKLKEILDESE